MARFLFASQPATGHVVPALPIVQTLADVIAGDPSVFAPFSVNERGGPPNAVYNVSCLGIKGCDVAPFGLGILPSGSSLGRLRNRSNGRLQHPTNLLSSLVSSMAGFVERHGVSFSEQGQMAPPWRASSLASTSVISSWRTPTKAV
jgi:hypothetical protein